MDIAAHYFEIQQKARDILLSETFSYANTEINHKYKEIGRESGKLQNCPNTVYFTHNGSIYPKTTDNGTSILNLTVLAPPLHCTLYERFDEASKILNETFDYDQIKNFFTEVVTKARNSVVFDALLPQVLISTLRNELKELNYERLDQGPYNVSGQQVYQEPLEETQENITNIRKQYAPIITLLKEQLMNKFLLQE